MRKFGLGGVVALGLGLTVAACGGETAGVDNGTGTAQVRVMNAAAGAPALDLVVGGKVIASGVQLGTTSALANMPGGTQTVAVRQSGQSGNLASRSVTIVPNARYALVVSGSLASLTLTAALTPAATVDTGLAKPDRANIRIINIARDAPTDSAQAPPSVLLDVYFTAPGADLGAATPTFSMDARYSSYSSLIYFDPGDWVIRFTNAGTKTVVATSATIPIGAGQIRAVTLQPSIEGEFVISVVTEN